MPAKQNARVTSRNALTSLPFKDIDPPAPDGRITARERNSPARELIEFRPSRNGRHVREELRDGGGRGEKTGRSGNGCGHHCSSTRGIGALTTVAKKNHNGAKMETGRAMPACINAAITTTARQRMTPQRRMRDIGLTIRQAGCSMKIVRCKSFSDAECRMRQRACHHWRNLSSRRTPPS